MNVLAFCVDEMRADHFAAAGNRVVRTPNIDAIAARGTRFTRSYCNNPICMPARATMFTGLLPRDHGLRINGQALRPDLPTLPGVLAAEGYLTHASGKLHLTPWVPKDDPPEPARYPESLDHWQAARLDRFPTPYYGFDSVSFVGGHTSYAYGEYTEWLRARGGTPEDLKRPIGEPSVAPQCYTMAMPEELHYNRFIADTTIDAIGRAREAEQPFFVWCSFPDPHHPFAPPEPYASMYDPTDCTAPARLSDEEASLPPYYGDVFDGTLRPNGVDNRPLPAGQILEMIARTYGMISHLDTEIGRVIASLEHSGLLDDTVIVFTGDHGDMMGDHGLILKGPYTFAGCTNTPLIISAPGRTTGAVSNSLVSQIDLMPTILDLCDIPMPGSDWTEQDTPFERGAIDPISTYPGRSAAPILEDSALSIREEVVIENDDPTTGFRVRALVTERHRLTVYPGFPFGELFDLASDPGEHRNLWDREPALRSDLVRRLLDAYSISTPLHPVPPWNS